MHRILPAILIASLVSLRATRLLAATVMLVRPVAPTPEVTETLTRLRGELLSVGLEVELAERTAVQEADGSLSRSSLERVATARGIDAVADVIGKRRAAAVELWVFKQGAPRSEVTRVVLELDADDAPARLAIRSLEVLRSLLIENGLSGPRPPAAPRAPAAATGDEGDRHPERPPRIGLELGAALLGGLDGVGTAILPVVRADAVLGSWLVLQAEVAAFGSRPTVSGAGGSARIAQQYFLVGGCVCAPSGRRLQPVLAALAGALRIDADGQADAPLQGHALAQWSALLELSAGARMRLTERSYLTLAAHVQLAEPCVSIDVMGTRAATIGRPNLLLTLTLGAWL